AVSAQALGDEFCGGMKTLRAALPVQARQTFEIALGGFAAELVSEGGDVFFREQGGLLREGLAGCGEQQHSSDGRESLHDGASGNARILQRLRWRARRV